MRIATYNINGLNARLPVLLRWLEEKQYDVACLQELKSPQERFPSEALKELGYEAVWHGQKSWNGVAVLVRGTSPVEVQRGLPNDPDETQSRYLEVDAGGVRVVCLYLPNGNPAPGLRFEYKLRWMEQLIHRAARLMDSGLPVVLAGDFNVIPTARDVYKPERWTEDALFRKETRSAFERLIAQGWTDAVRTLHPAATIYTYFDYYRNAFQRHAGLRIDHLLLSPSLAPRLRAAAVDLEVRGWEKSSDHAPVWIEIAGSR